MYDKGDAFFPSAFVIVDAHIFFGKKKEEEFRAKEIAALVDFVMSQEGTKTYDKIA